MKIGLVSDTHMPRSVPRLPRALERGLRDADVALILHCGDFTELYIADFFAALAPFDGVAGNNDGDQIIARFGRKKIVRVGDVRIGLIHGDGGDRQQTPERAFAAFRDDDVNIVCFGHSHMPLVERRGNVWLVNPGSACDKRRMPHFSYAIIEIVGTIITPMIYFYDDKS